MQYIHLNSTVAAIDLGFVLAQLLSGSLGSSMDGAYPESLNFLNYKWRNVYLNCEISSRKDVAENRMRTDVSVIGDQ